MKLFTSTIVLFEIYWVMTSFCFFSYGILDVMDDTKKMLQAIINGQSAMKGELINKIDGVERNFGTRIDKLEGGVDKGFKQVGKRIDKLGTQLAYLDDDAPTREERDELENRIDKVEERIVSV